MTKQGANATPRYDEVHVREIRERVGATILSGHWYATDVTWLLDLVAAQHARLEHCSIPYDAGYGDGYGDGRREFKGQIEACERVVIAYKRLLSTLPGWHADGDALQAYERTRMGTEGAGE